MASPLPTARIAALAVLAACAAALPPAAAAAPLVRSDPSLFPTFERGAADYVVRCKQGEHVTLTVDAPAGTKVGVADRDARGGRYNARVRLDPGRAFSIRVRAHDWRRTHHVRCLPADFPRFHVTRKATPQAAWYLLTPSEFDTSKRGYVALFDSRGVPVWWRGGTPPPFDAHLLPDGNLAWTHIAINNPASGPAEEHSFDGRLVRTYATHGTSANEHDLQVQPDGSAFMIAYPPRDHVDLSHWGGPSDATVLDGQIQEIDPAGNLVWSWLTAAHVRLVESGRWLHRLIFQTHPLPLPDGRQAYDIVHLNSVDPFGDRLVLSDRYNDAVFEIDRATKRILWKLGGRPTDKSLKIVGDPLAGKELGGQHDARVLDGGRTITVYDNGMLRDRPPRALEFRIDEHARTARLVRSIEYGPAKDSVCCGSTRLLPGGDWVTSWGHTRWVTEQTGSAHLVLGIEFQEDTSSYRAEPVLHGRLGRSALRRGMDAMAGGG